MVGSVPDSVTLKKEKLDLSIPAIDLFSLTPLEKEQYVQRIIGVALRLRGWKRQDVTVAMTYDYNTDAVFYRIVYYEDPTVHVNCRCDVDFNALQKALAKT